MSYPTNSTAAKRAGIDPFYTTDGQVRVVAERERCANHPEYFRTNHDQLILSAQPRGADRRPEPEAGREPMSDSEPSRRRFAVDEADRGRPRAGSGPVRDVCSLR